MSDQENKYNYDSSSFSEDDDTSSHNDKNYKNIKKTDEYFYPLKNTWIMYDHTKSDSDTYESSTRKISEFNDVIHFWQLINNYPSPSKLFNNGIHRPMMKCNEVDEPKEITSLSVFKKGILPKWEDPANKYGAEFSKRKFNKKDPLAELDSNWIDILIACIGSTIDESVTGLRVVDSSSPKKNEYNGNTEFKLVFRIEVWFDSMSKKQVIEEQLKNIFCINDPKSGLYYKEHNIEE